MHPTRATRLAPTKALVILASFARERVFDTRRAGDAGRWAAVLGAARRRVLQCHGEVGFK